MKGFLIAIAALVALHAHANGAGLSGLSAGTPSQVESKAAKGVLPLKNRTVLGLTIGTHTLAVVTKQLGEAPIVKAESIDSRPNTICYFSSTDDTAVLYEAGPLGGFEILTGVTVAPRSAFDPALNDCVSSVKVSRKAAGAGSLRLGSNISKVAASLGATVKVTKQGLAEIPFEKTTKRHVKGRREPAEVDIASGIAAKTGNGEVVWFSIYYIESM